MLASDIPGQVIGERDPSLCRHRRVLVQLRGTEAIWTEVGPEMSFAEMSSGRRVPITAAAVRAELAGNGFLAANLGVSAAITLRHGDESFALVAFQGGRDVGDRAHQLISGYRESGETVMGATARELGEELVLHDGAAHARLWLQGVGPLPGQAALAYGSTVVDLREAHLPAFVRAPSRRRNPGLYFQVSSHSAQIVSGFTLELGRDRDWTLSHVEDSFNPATGRLESRLRVDGVRLVRLGADGQVLPEVYTLWRGHLLPVDGPVSLSEAFCEGEDGIVDCCSRRLCG